MRAVYFNENFVQWPCNCSERCHFDLDLYSSSCCWLPFRDPPLWDGWFSSPTPSRSVAGWNDAMVDVLWHEVFAVLNNDMTSTTASVVDARLVRQTAAEETVGKDPIVVGTPTHAPHVVAIGFRVGRQVSRPAPTRRCRWRHFRWRQQQYGSRQSQRDAQSLYRAVQRRHL